MAAARILVQLLDGDTVVHEYRRATTLHETESLVRMIRAAMGWMQAYGDQATLEQWRRDIARAERSQG